MSILPGASLAGTGRHAQHGKRFALAVKFARPGRRFEASGHYHDKQENRAQAGKAEAQPVAAAGRWLVGAWRSARRHGNYIGVGDVGRNPCRQSLEQALGGKPLRIVDRRKITQAAVAQDRDDDLPRSHLLRQSDRAPDVDPRR